MQTFLPYPDFTQSARVLDNKRLNRQRSETKQILNIVARINSKSSWRNHPAVLQWMNHPRELALYGLAICSEHRRRGFKDSLKPWFRRMASQFRGSQLPFWFGREDVHSSHRARLLEKNPEWYAQFGWAEQPTTENVWPVRKSKK